MNKSNDWQQNPQDMGGPSFHPAVTALGPLDSANGEPPARKPSRIFNSFRSLAEILGTPDADEALHADNKSGRHPTS